MSKQTGRFFDSINFLETLLNREWLEKKSKDELIDLVMFLANERQTVMTSTAQGFFEELETLEFPEIDFTRIENFKQLPTRTVTQMLKRPWKIMLVSPKRQGPHLPLALFANIMVGMPGGEDVVDLTLEQYDGRLRGVSRMHAMLQVSDQDLFLIDMRSTNGTYLNNIMIESDKPHRLQNGDQIAFSRVVFQVRIIESPQTK